MVTDNGLIESIFEQFEKSHYSTKVMKATLDYFKYYDFDIEKINLNTFYKYIYDFKIEFNCAYYMNNIIKSFLIKKMGLPKDRWKTFRVSEQILEHCDMEYETRNIITNNEWEAFQLEAENFLQNKSYIRFFKNYVKLSFAWNLINPNDFPKIKKSDVKIKNSITEINIYGDIITIKDNLLCCSLKKIFSNDDKELFLKEKSGESKINIFDFDFQDIYYSGAAYFLTVNKKINVSKNNNYLMPYLKAISKYMYGENREE